MKRLVAIGVGSGIIGLSLGMMLTTRTVVQEKIVYKDKLVYSVSAPCPPVVAAPIPVAPVIKKPKPKQVAYKKTVKPQPKYTVMKNDRTNEVQAP